MPVVVSVLGASLAALTALLVVGALTAGAAGTSVEAQVLAGDPEPAERWFVDHIARHPALRRVVATLDRHVWGGAMVAIGLAAVCGAAALIGWILSTIDRGSGFARLDESAAEWGAEHATDGSTAVLRAITLLGSTAVLFSLLLAVGLLALWRAPGRNWSMPGFLLTVGVGIVLVNNAIKWIVERDRPTVTHLAGSAGSSFPSGHTASAAACWAALALLVSRRWPTTSRRLAAAVAAALAVLVASSRVLLGVHWLTDVIAGLIVGWTWFFVVALVFGGRIQRFGDPAARVAARDRTARDRTGRDRTSWDRIGRDRTSWSTLPAAARVRVDTTHSGKERRR